MIADFRISKEIDSALTRGSQTVVGKSRDYMSPDRYDYIMKDSKKIVDEEKNDVFAIGIIILQILGF